MSHELQFHLCSMFQNSSRPVPVLIQCSFSAVSVQPISKMLSSLFVIILVHFESYYVFVNSRNLFIYVYRHIYF